MILNLLLLVTKPVEVIMEVRESRIGKKIVRYPRLKYTNIIASDNLPTPPLLFLLFTTRLISSNPPPYSHRYQYHPHNPSPVYHRMSPYVMSITRMTTTLKGYSKATITTARTRKST